MNTKTNLEKATAFDVLIEHCQEMYPHFESERGQRDIANAKAEHAALNEIAEALKAAQSKLIFDWVCDGQKLGFSYKRIREMLLEIPLYVQMRDALSRLEALRKEGK